MKSRKKTRTNKSRVLIAFGKGIASTLALELAMLFSHSGAEVRAALIDSAHEWLAEAPLKQICGHSPLTAGHQPGWFFAGLEFDACLIVSPSTLVQQQLLSGQTADPIIEYLLGTGQTFHILQNRQQMPSDTTVVPANMLFSELPAQPGKLSGFFQKVFADTTARIVSQALLKRATASISFLVPEALQPLVVSRPEWLRRLQSGLEKYNIRVEEPDNATDMFISAYDGPTVDTAENRLTASRPAEKVDCRLQVTFVAADVADSELTPAASHIFVRRRPNGLIIVDRHGQRFLPDVCGACCYDRLASYLAVNLSRKLKPDMPEEPA